MARSALLNIMVTVALKAGRSLKRDFGEVENLQVSVKSPSDFVSTADLASERTIRAELERARPGFSFLMEEGGVVTGKDPDHVWIIDPLDGTTNFLHSDPHFCISMALAHKGELLAGLIYNPVLDELYWAEKGKGAFLNSRRLRVSGRRDMGEARQILFRVHQHRQRRIAHRPARNLPHRIIDHGERLAIAHDQQRHALLILEANAAGLLHRQRARGAGGLFVRAVGELRGVRPRYRLHPDAR